MYSKMDQEKFVEECVLLLICLYFPTRHITRNFVDKNKKAISFCFDGYVTFILRIMQPSVLETKLHGFYQNPANAEREV